MPEQQNGKDDADFTVAQRIKPAFAGALVDLSIGPREITATIIDLVIRDYLFVQGETLVRLPKKDGLAPFEEQLTNIVFGNNDSLSFAKLAVIAYSEKAEEIRKLIVRGMLEDGIIAADFQKRLADATKAMLKEELGVTPVIPRNAMRLPLPPWLFGEGTFKAIDESRKAIFVGAAVIVVATALMFGIGMVTKNISLVCCGVGVLVASLAAAAAVMPFLSMGYRMFDITDTFKKAAVKDVEKRMGSSVADALLTARGKEYQKQARTLLSYMTAHPLMEERLADELVAHAVAFGIGAQWKTKMGKTAAALGSLVEWLESAGNENVMQFIDLDEYMKAFEAPTLP